MAIRSNSNNYYKDFLDEFNAYSSNLLSSKSKANTVTSSTSSNAKQNGDIGQKNQIDKIILIKNANESGTGGTSVIAMMIEKSNSKIQMANQKRLLLEQPNTGENCVEKEKKGNEEKQKEEKQKDEKQKEKEKEKEEKEEEKKPKEEKEKEEKPKEQEKKKKEEEEKE